MSSAIKFAGIRTRDEGRKTLSSIWGREGRHTRTGYIDDDIRQGCSLGARRNRCGPPALFPGYARRALAGLPL